MKKIPILIAMAMLVASSVGAIDWSMRAQQSSAAWTSATPLDTRLSVPVVSYSTVLVTVSATSTMTAGTLNFEGSVNNASTFPFAVPCIRLNSSASGGVATPDVTFPLAVTNSAWQCAVAGFTHFGVRLNPAITGTGTATLTMQATAAPLEPPKFAGSAGQGTPDATTRRVFIAQKATYYFATTAKTATAAGTGPFFSICGSSTKTVRLQQLAIGGTVATAAVYGDVILKKTSTSTSAGTATALTKVPADSTSAASTANLLNFYTALATAGSAVGAVGAQNAVFPLTGTVAASEASIVFDYTNRQEAQAPTLIGTAQCIEASFGTTTTNAPTLTVAGIYTEE